MTTLTIDPPAVSSAQCPACGGNDWQQRFTKKGRDYKRCKGCGLEGLRPLPNLEDLEAYYDESYSDGLYSEFVEAEKMKRLTARARLSQLKRVAPGAAWLDVGCADGLLLEELSRQGHDAVGIELSGVATKRGQDLGRRVISGSIEEFEWEHPFDVVSGFDVLEHVLDPADFLGHVRRLLRPGGLVAMTVPNLHSFSHTMMRNDWFFYIAEEHLHLYTPKSLRMMLERCGFENVRWWPTYKPLTFEYSMEQFKEYNPWIYRLLRPVSWVTPRFLQQLSVPLYIGELMIVAEKSDE